MRYVQKRRDQRNERMKGVTSSTISGENAVAMMDGTDRCVASNTPMPCPPRTASARMARAASGGKW
jgi:hypothetical protein